MDSLKINFDAALNMEFGRVGVGVIARDHDGNFVSAMAHNFVESWDPDMAEAKAAAVAVKLASDQGYKNVCFEGDASSLLNIIQGLQGVSCRSGYVQLAVLLIILVLIFAFENATK